jgi:hypothetical protein
VSILYLTPKSFDKKSAVKSPLIKQVIFCYQKETDFKPDFHKILILRKSDQKTNKFENLVKNK